MPADLVATVGAARAWHAQVKDLGGLRCLPRQFGALAFPLGVQHARQPVYDNIEKTANSQAQNRQNPHVKPR